MVTAISFFGLFVVLVTEVLGALHLIARGPVTIMWACVTAIALVLGRGRIPSFRRRAISLETGVLAAIAVITLLLGITNPPWHPDTTTYHVPRILHWIQNSTLDPYPTHIDRQIWIGAGAEYFVLHLRIIAGSDRVLTLVQWLSFIGIAPLVSLIARELGASRRGQAFAALFALTMPMAITQATGAQPDLFASLWLCVAVALLLRIRRRGLAATSWVDALAFGSAAGIAVLAKAVNALYLLPFVVWALIDLLRARRLRRLAALAGLAFLPTLAVNAGHVHRNMLVWGNPLGAHAGYGVANEIISPASVASNVIRNLSLHAKSGFDTWNDFLYMGIVKAHTLLGISHDDRRTTYGQTHFSVPQKVEDEGISGNRWHLVIIAAAVVLAWRRRDRLSLVFLGCVAAGALMFAAYLKWQPWNSGFHLPLFVVSAGAVAAILEKSLSERRLRQAGWFLLAFAMFPLFRNEVLPVVGRTPVFTVPYETRLTRIWEHGGRLRAAADLIASSECRLIGLVWHRAAPEYPVWKLMEARAKGPVEIRHVSVTNETRRFASARDRSFQPCALISLTLDGSPSPRIPPGYRVAQADPFMTVWLKTQL